MPPSFSIALAHDHLYQFGGAERVLEELRAMYPQAPIYTLIHSDLNKTAFAQSKVIASYLQRIPFVTNYFRWLLPLMPAAWEKFSFDNYDMVISSSSAFVKGLIVPPGTTHICYCHTPTRYLWGDSAEYVDNLHFPKFFRWLIAEQLHRLRTWDQLAAQRADHIIANSKYVASKIAKYYKRESTVIYPPVDTSRFTVSAEQDNYFLIISRLRPYKRVDLAIKAFNALRLPLVIIGQGEEYSYLRRLAKNNITFLGEVSSEVRNNYLSRCQALIHPQEEDFGITVVEAMASGRPVIAYGAGGALESILPNQTGLFFNQQTWESLADAISFFDSRNFDPQFIRQHAQRFDLQIFKQEIDQLIRTVYEATHH